MKLTPEEMGKAKRAATRLWCKGDENGKHTLRKTVLPCMSHGWMCSKCGFTLKRKEVA